MCHFFCVGSFEAVETGCFLFENTHWHPVWHVAHV